MDSLKHSLRGNGLALALAQFLHPARDLRTAAWRAFIGFVSSVFVLDGSKVAGWLGAAYLNVSLRGTVDDTFGLRGVECAGLRGDTLSMSQRSLLVLSHAAIQSILTGRPTVSMSILLSTRSPPAMMSSSMSSRDWKDSTESSKVHSEDHEASVVSSEDIDDAAIIRLRLQERSSTNEGLSLTRNLGRAVLVRAATLTMVVEAGWSAPAMRIRMVPSKRTNNWIVLMSGRAG